MQWHGLKIPVIILSLLIGIAIIFSAQWLYQKYSFQGPLNVALNGNKAVESFQIGSEGRMLRISVTIRYDADLMQSYKEIHKEITRIVDKRPFHLVLNDSRDDILNQVWYNSHFAIYQAVFQGSYQEMAAVVNREAAAYDTEAKIYVDQENIYLRLKHQGHTFDEVIPRVTGQLPAAGGGVYAQRN